MSTRLDTVNSSTYYANMAESPMLAEGKTKIVRAHPKDSNLAIFVAKDDITAGDGAKHDIIPGKSELATKTTCNVFRLLAKNGIPVAFREQIDNKSFVGDYCNMIEYEVVVRREAHGSYLKRHPGMEKGHVFSDLIVEFFLKTTKCMWKGQSIPKDDPFIQFKDGKAYIYRPDLPIESQQPFMVLSDYPLHDQPALFKEISDIALNTFLVLEKAWKANNGRLVDFKVEFGINKSGTLLLADVIDNDSWRVIQDQNYIDKQVYRDGGDINKVAALYRHVSELTDGF